MTRKTKKKSTPVTWYGGRFLYQTQSGEQDLFVWATLHQEIIYKLLPRESPDSALLDLYLEATRTQTPPGILHLPEERWLPLFRTTPKVTLKSGKRTTFLIL